MAMPKENNLTLYDSKLLACAHAQLNKFHKLCTWFMLCCVLLRDYRQVSNVRRTLVGNKIVDHSDVVGAAPVGAAPTTSSFST